MHVSSGMHVFVMLVKRNLKKKNAQILPLELNFPSLHQLKLLSFQIPQNAFYTIFLFVSLILEHMPICILNDVIVSSFKLDVVSNRGVTGKFF